MKIMKEIRALKEEDVEKNLADSRKELMRLQSQVASGTLPKNPGRIKLMRKTIARLYTIKTEREKQRNE